jgi:hypothetical protein
LIAILLLPLSLPGCAGKKTRPDLLATVNSVKPAGGLSKKIGIVLVGSEQSARPERLTALYLQTLIDEMHDEDGSLELVTAQDGELPSFLANADARPDPVELALEGRRFGYQGLALASISDISVFTRRTGFLWFRKMRPFASVNLTFDVYDPVTASKIVESVRELTVKIGESEYDAFSSGEDADMENLDEAVEDAADEMAEQAAETLEDMPWQSTVAAVRSGRLVIPASRLSGLEVGQRLAIFEGRRTIEGPKGGRFVIPGKQVAEVRVTAIGHETAEAAGESLDAVQPGDIVVPVR